MAKKNARKSAAEAAQIEALAFNCFTDPALAQTWKSKINGTTVNDGEFRIYREDAFGNFDGLHSVNSTAIRGQCSGAGFWFVRPADNPRHLYKGTFQTGGGDPKVKGTRTAIPAFGAAAGAAGADDTWEADKTT
jgi:hypothetical protein